MKTTLLHTENLVVGYGKGLLPPVSAALSAGDVIALLGANGIGKSTLLKTLSGELRPVAGKVFIGDDDLASVPRKRLSRSLAIVTTDTTGAGGLTVRQTVSLGRHPYTGFLGQLSEEDRKIVDQSMMHTGISYKADEYFARLSDGEKQKTLIARALAQETKIILLDEPFSFLDTASRIEILSLLKKAAAEKGIGVLFSSHDVSQALRMASGIWMLTNDREFIQGSPDFLVRTNSISRMFDNRGIVFDASQNDFISAKD